MELEKNIFEDIPITDIHLRGWALRQLQIQANGISGTLCDFWPDVKDSAWIGGDAEGWERVPYWLDGFIPLAFLTKRVDLQEKAEFYINEIIARQCEDGWIMPGSKKRDLWAYMLMCKVFTVWHDMTEDDRIEDVLYRALKSLDKSLDSHTLYDWGQVRWFEALIPIAWLYRRRPEDWMLRLVQKLSLQGFDWLAFFDTNVWPYRTIEDRKHWSFFDHVVNNAMALRQGVLEWQFSGDESLFEETENMQAMLDKYHGMVTGMFSGDECLAGKSPVQGTELCAVVEYMFSLENLIKATGRVAWADRLEKVAFNALPATFSPDMQTHQYIQQVNQILCAPVEDNVYRTNPADSNMFGVEPNYGCCTANLSQGWPKFMRSAYMKKVATESDAEGIAVISYMPCEINTPIKGIPVSLRVDTMYPFKEEVKMTVTPSMPFEFPIYFRIPEWVEYADIYVGEEKMRPSKGEFYKLEGYWEGETEIRIILHSEFKLVDRANKLSALTCGPLVYAMPIKERWDEYYRDMSYHRYPHCDYTVYPEGDWNYAFYVRGDKPEFEVRENRGPAIFVFSPDTPPVEVWTDAKKVEWPVVRSAAAPIPHTKNASFEVEKIRLIPYGCTNLRMTEMPVIKE